MINKRLSNLKMFCDDYTSIENYDKAITDQDRTWDCHHRLEIGENGEVISKQDLISHGLYYHRPSEELIFLTRTEHIRLHKKGKTHSEETRTKMSESHKGKTHPHKGRPMSEKQKRRLLEGAKKYWERKRKMTKE